MNTQTQSSTQNPHKTLGRHEILDAERQAILARREELEANELGHLDGFFGIALSGGGIRSATVSLGFLQILNHYGVFKAADYLSTVSGGGYLGAYVHSKLHRLSNEKDVSQLFAEEDINHLRDNARYLTPGDRSRYFFNLTKMITSVCSSMALNALFMILFFLSVVLLIGAFWTGLPALAKTTGILLLGVFFLCLILHIFFPLYRPTEEKHNGFKYYETVITMETGIFIVVVLYLPAVFGIFTDFSSGTLLLWALGIFTIAVLLGFIMNPNKLGVHHFYRERLKGTYIVKSESEGHDIRLNDLWVKQSRPVPAPYPLINTCVTLLNESPAVAAETANPPADRNSQQFGRMAVDYFLLSPLFCGSKLTRYHSTSEKHHAKLSTAMATSGAALNPSMGIRTNRVVSLALAFFGLRLGRWTVNPSHSKKTKKTGTYSGIRRLLQSAFTAEPACVWWPKYHIAEVFGTANSTYPLVNLSDGGNIENLGVFELLRRRCKFIVALDATADPAYSFDDLNNLVLRARHELGITIDFLVNPEDAIRPIPSVGASQSHFVVATLSDLDGKTNSQKCWGTLIYVKSSLKKQRRWRELQEYQKYYKPGHDYKNNRPSFPHEPTTDQFFGPDQWQAYYQLGRFIAGDLLQRDVRDKDTTHQAAQDLIRLEELMAELGQLDSIEKLENYATQVDDDNQETQTAVNPNTT